MKPIRADIVKVEDDQQLVFGWANVIKTADDLVLLDRQDDFIDSESELEKAAYHYVLHSRDGGEMHVQKGVSTLVESIVLTKEKQDALGIRPGSVPTGWWIGFRVNDGRVWDQVKKGGYVGFSVHGTGRRQRIDLPDGGYTDIGKNSSDISKVVRQKPNGRWCVYSESGRLMGEYDTEAEAKKRLAQIERFKKGQPTPSEVHVDSTEWEKRKRKRRTLANAFLAKFNPYHDELGRFATAEGSAGAAESHPRFGGSKPRSEEELRATIEDAIRTDDRFAGHKRYGSRDYRRIANNISLKTGEKVTVRQVREVAVSAGITRAQREDQEREGRKRMVERFERKERERRALASAALAKFNPYHDELGRFTTANSAVTTAGFEGSGGRGGGSGTRDGGPSGMERTSTNAGAPRLMGLVTRVPENHARVIRKVRALNKEYLKQGLDDPDASLDAWDAFDDKALADMRGLVHTIAQRARDRGKTTDTRPKVIASVASQLVDRFYDEIAAPEGTSRYDRSSVRTIDDLWQQIADERGLDYSEIADRDIVEFL